MSDDENAGYHGHPSGGDGAVAAARKKTRQVFKAFQERVGPDNFKVTPLENALAMVGALKKRSVRATTSFRGPLAIGNVGLPVWSWRKVVSAGAPKMVNVSKAALEEPEGLADPAKTVEIQRRYTLQSAPDEDVPPTMHVPGYRFGRDLVPVAPSEADGLKYGVEAKVLELIGLVPRAELPRHMLITRPECVVPEPGAAGGNANKALQALLLALEEEEMVMIARYAPRKGAAPTLVSLWPAITCFWMIGIPFADEMKSFDWGAPPTAPPPTAAQLDAAAALIDAFDLQSSAEAIGDAATQAKSEALRPKDVFSPKLQRTYQCIQHRARALISAPSSAADDGHAADDGPAASTNLPPPDPRITQPLTPDPQLLAKASSAIDAFAALCPLEFPSTAGSKRTRVTGGDGDGAPEKHARVDGGGSSQLLPLAITTKATKVTVDNPIVSFHEMIEDETVDRTKDALEGMSGVVKALFDRAAVPEDAPATRAYQCLREMRRSSVCHETPESYNSLLHELREAFRGALGSRGVFWSALVDNLQKPGYGLITSTESPDMSHVSAEDAAAFWEAASPPAQSLPAEGTALSDTFDEPDLDCL